MAAKLGRWSVTLKLSALLLVLFFLISNFSFLWLSYKAKNALEGELKVKLEDAGRRLSRLAAASSGTEEARRSVEVFLVERELAAFGFFNGPLPTVWTNPENKNPFMADSRPAAAPRLSGPVKFGGHFSCGYSFPAALENGLPLPAGFVIAQVDSWGRLEKLFKLQTFFWMVGFVLMAGTLGLLWRFVLAPFEAMEKKAAEARLVPSGGPSDDPADLTLASFEKALAELKAKEKELSRLYAESERRALHYSALSRHLIESLGSGIVIFDPEGNIIDFNPAAAHLLGMGKERRLPAAFKKVLPEAKLGRAAESVELDVEAGGHKRILAVSVSAISDPDGKVLGKAVLVSDLTDFKKMETELKEREHWAFLGETAAGLAHELRNALAVMVGYGKLLAKAFGEEHPSRRTIDGLLRESQGAEETLKRFLEYARPGVVFAETVDFSSLVAEILASLQNRFPRVRFEAALPPAAAGRSDPALLKQIFSNLLGNAAEAAGPGGWVKVTLEARPSGWQIMVADSGPGISKEVRDKIFSPFFTTKADGTGLGLALVKKAVHLLEGEIRLEGAENGAVFVVMLPGRLRNLPLKDEIQKEHHVR